MLQSRLQSKKKMKNKSKPTFGKCCYALSKLAFQVFAIVLIIRGEVEGLLLMGSVSYGDAGAPSDITTYLDSVFSTSLANYRKTLADNIGASNAFLNMLIAGGMYESFDGGTDIREPLMYELAPSDWYDGYDELPDNVTDGITESTWPSRQLATPISYSMKEVIQNRQRIIDLVKSKIMQGEMGIQEGFATALMQGAGTGSIQTAKTGSGGATAIDPIAKIIDYTPTSSTVIGNINQSTSSWWQNNTATSTATTYAGLLAEFLNFYNTCALGSGGPPDLILVNQGTYEYLSLALYNAYRNTQGDDKFPFTNIRLPFGSGGTLLVMDDKVPDVANDNIAIQAGGGTAFFINTKFFRLRFIPERNFSMLTDENGKTFAKPSKGDSRLGHLAWMGALTCNNRRKQGVMGSISTTLSS